MENYSHLYNISSPLSTLASIGASGALFLCVLKNRKAPRCLPWKLDILVVLKALLGLVYIAAAAEILACAKTEGNTCVLPIVGLAAAITFVAASLSEHYHSVAPSTVTTLYAIFGAAFYGYQLQAYQLKEPIPYFYSNIVATASLLALIILEGTSKRRLLLPTDPPPAYVSTLSFLVKPFFPQLLPILAIGSRRRIKVSELHEIPVYLRADPATKRLQAALATGDKTSPRYLARCSFRAFGWEFLRAITPRLIFLTGTFAQVALVEQMIIFASDESQPTERGIFLIAMFFLVYISMTLSNYLYCESLNAFFVLYSSALTGSLYAKTLRMTSMAARELGQGAATTYMSVDINKVIFGLQLSQELWAAGLTVGVACAMLWAKAGYAMLAPLLFITALLASTSAVSTFVGLAQKVWVAAIDARIKLFTSVLRQLLPIKLGAYEPALTRKLHALRERETQALRRFLYTISVAGTLANSGSAGAFLATLAAYVTLRARGWGDLPPLDVSRLFTLFTIVDILNAPLSLIGQTLPHLFAGFASLERIQGFLQLPEKIDAVLSPEVETALVDVTEDVPVQVSLAGCAFEWDDTTRVLHGVTMDLTPRELHMVVGPVASGKTSLLMSLLGEMRLVEGTMTVTARKVALASQTAFIFPGTLRANILLDSPFDAGFYERVIDACGLRQDIDALPHRDLGILGDRGTTLSGGQRQRVAIARAVYARADLVLLDDVFSALDGETEAHVFASLFGPKGLLRGTTTVLVTHGVHHLPSADKVIVMDAGTITHFDSFDHVREAAAIFTRASTPAATGSGGDSFSAPQKANAAESTVVDAEKEEEEAWSADQASRRGAYTFYARCMGFVPIGIVLVLVTARSTVGLLSAAYLSRLTSAEGHLGQWVAGYGGLVLLDVVFVAATLMYFAYVIGSFTAANIHSAELAGVMGAPISWITKNPVGKSLSRFSQDIQVADREFSYAVLFLALNVLTTIGTFVFIMLATPPVAFGLPFLGLVSFYSLRYYLATSKQFHRLELSSKSPVYTLFGTTISGLITVRAYRAQNYFRSQNAAFLNECQGALHHRVTGQLFLRTFMMWFQTILACGFAVLTVYLRDTTSAALLGIALSRLVALGPMLTNLLFSYASVENGTIAIDRIQEYANLPAEEQYVKAQELTAGDLSAWPSAGRVTFSNFSVRYSDDLPLALKNLSFELEGGLKIGICGRTGSGKSSTVLSLFRGIDQHLVTGSIAIDGVDISTVPLKTLRESMSIVTQDPFLWHGSIRENLDILSERSDSEIWDALKLVEMYDAVSALDDKLDHLVVDEESFSKGQRQLLCLARVLLRNNKIIVLDESTSSMDHVTDEKIRHVVNSKMEGFTVIAIAHRISTIVNYDKILVLDSGSIAEFDDPKTLLSNSESRFARLAATQGIYHPDLIPQGAAVKDLGDGTTLVVTEDLVDV